MPSRFAPCALLVSILTIVLLAGDGDAASGNVTAAIINNGCNSSATVRADSNGPETYACVLCAGRNLMLIRWCPLYWDECHLVCDSGAVGSSGAVPAVLPGEASTLDADADIGDDDDCYVMKVYSGGRYVIVADTKCGQVKTCGLTCGGGDVLRGAGGNALPVAATRVGVAPAAAAAVFRGPRLAESQRCGVQAAMASARRAVQRGA